MNLRVDINKAYKQTEVIVKTPNKTEKIDQLIAMIHQFFNELPIKNGTKTLQLNILEIVYIENIERKTFIYTKNSMYEDERPLYAFESMLKDFHFIRINKQTIINPRYIHSVNALLNSRYEITLETQEKLIVTRHYRNTFKKLFEAGGMFDA